MTRIAKACGAGSAMLAVLAAMLGWSMGCGDEVARDSNAAEDGATADGSVGSDTDGPPKSDQDGAADAISDAPDSDRAVGKDYSPTDVPGLAIWFTAADAMATNGEVATWTDRVHGIVAKKCAFGPVLVPGPNGIGKALLFPHPPVDGGSVETCLTIPDLNDDPANAPIHWGTSGFALFVVGRHTNSPNGQPTTKAVLGSLAGYAHRFLGSISNATYCPGGASCGHGIGLFGNSNGSVALHPLAGDQTGIQAVFVYPSTGNTTPRTLVTSTTTGFNDGVFRLYGVRRLANGNVELYANSATVGSATFTPTNVDGSGALYFGPLEGAIAEVVAIKGDLSDADRDTLISGFLGKYALP